MTSQYRHRRTSNPSTAFPNPLEPGEISVNTANRQIAVGDAQAGVLGAPLQLLALRIFDTRAIYTANDMVYQAGVVYRAKGAAGPGAFTPAQWDMLVGTTDPQYVAKSGDTMSGMLTLPATMPTLGNHATHKTYVDGKVAAKSTLLVSQTPPAGANDGDLWLESDTGLIFVRYNDGNSTAWIIAFPQPDMAAFKSYVDTKIIASDTPPVGVSDNTIWFESDTGLSFYRFNDGTSTQWVSFLAGSAPLDSPTFTGDPKTPTPPLGDNDTSIANTSFVQSAVALGLANIPISNSAWTVYPMTFTMTAGGAGTGAGRYTRIGKTVFFTFVLTCTTAGNFGTGSLPLPTASPGSYNIGFVFAREVMANGRGWHGQIGPGGGTTFGLTETATNAFALTAGWQLQGAGFYETA